jgi:hypothetical protein
MSIAQIKPTHERRDTPFRNQLKDSVIDLIAKIDGLERDKRALVLSHSAEIKRLKKRLQTTVREMLSDESYLFDYQTPEDFFVDKGI